MINQIKKPRRGLIFMATNGFEQDTTPNGVAPSPHIIRSINVQFLRNYGKYDDKANEKTLDRFNIYSNKWGRTISLHNSFYKRTIITELLIFQK